ncbi:MAG: mannitol dehydrogenase [Candidatus Epulonipiscioides saccharophilum]|nr:MAG: mannitol dehydrogenase [Epulopiscium sp. AS2M-Bin001]
MLAYDIEDVIEQNDIKIPNYDVQRVIKQTDLTPTWIHFGGGNIFRGYIAKIVQNLLNQELINTGIILAETFDFEIIDKIYKPYNNLTLLVTLNNHLDKEIITSVTNALKCNDKEDMQILKDAFKNPSLQMVSFTITEKGYALTDLNHNYFEVIKNDILAGPDNSQHVVSILCGLLLERFNAGQLPISLVSMDNCSDNGLKLKHAVITMAKEWQAKKFVSDDFIAYLQSSNVAFPISMIDKITPRPAKDIEDQLTAIGLNNMHPITTSKNTFIAPFVNAEEAEYLVIEDLFPNGRPPLEQAGVYITDLDTVRKVETMKVTTCLNPLHTALAVFGVVLGYNRIFQEMQDPQLKILVEGIGNEGMKVVEDPKIIDPKQFLSEVFDRLNNPFVPDDPARIATDTSQKVGIRFGQTIKSYLKADLNLEDLTFIPLAIAGWFRYLLGVDDNGQKIDLSPDPMLKELQTAMKGLELGQPYNGEIEPILRNEKIFGLDLVTAGLSQKIETMLKELIMDKGSVKATLKKYCSK